MSNLYLKEFFIFSGQWTSEKHSDVAALFVVKPTFWSFIWTCQLHPSRGDEASLSLLSGILHNPALKVTDLDAQRARFVAERSSQMCTLSCNDLFILQIFQM